ncbi:MAG: type-F conjugative transfer system pilin assembly protein TrbC [Proteobacteria bacterium]|nr:type-F conjugative transfer system pilin assembly protein TrbC [Pseudomonadota bacterium]
MKLLFALMAVYTPFLYALNNPYSPDEIGVYNQLNGDLNTNKKQLESKNKGINEAFKLFQNSNIEHPKLSDKYIDIASEISGKSKGIITENIGKMHHDKKTTKIYYFISFSMPESLIKAYLLDAIWTGGSVIIKGILPKYDNIYKFVGDKLKPLVYGNQMAAIEINPNLFEMYNITKVPSIVVTQNNKLSGCNPLNDTGFSATETCAQLPEKSYYKISGNIDTTQQLETIRDAGCPYVTSFIKRLDGLQDRMQTSGFSLDGNNTDWASAPMPLSKDQIKRNLQMIGLDISGMSVGSSELIDQIKSRGDMPK